MILGVVGGSNNKPSPASAISSSSGRATGAERERALGHPVRAEGHRHRPISGPPLRVCGTHGGPYPSPLGEGLQAGESYEIFAASAIRANPRWGYL